MIRLGTRDAMIIVCESNRLRLYKFELPSEDVLDSKEGMKFYCKLLDRHYRKCGRIIRLFVKAAS